MFSKAQTEQGIHNYSYKLTTSDEGFLDLGL